MSLIDTKITGFVDALASGEPVPGGGGASALAGAVGAALGSMVGNLTLGKKKYADVQDDMARILARALELRAELLSLIDRDAAGFEPLARAYGIPKDDPSRAEIMEAALRTACVPPLEIMRACAEAIMLLDELSQKGSALAVSDAGAGAALCKAALMAASLNVYINTKSMTDRLYAADTEAASDALLEEYCPLADTVYGRVVNSLRGDMKGKTV
ncbi:MAG: cyclodeaminase/cyclohydrolase family protein [Oscillospiraceae bacterium]|jgi:formiminotetrahydrofolate cyclodeaminase|nr:cyclodeaminase/cyclohydrolase family protein [Oscillospiraceae bacterium]